MIKFFRKIRYDLMKKNKTGKYFKYAIGEITLVVVGILIALSINNWNEKQKDNNLEQIFLQKLKSNLQDDITLYKSVSARNDEYTKHLDSALIMLHNYKNHTTKDFQNHLQYLMFSSRFNTNKTAFNNLMSIGKMNIIQNDSITESLFLYYRRVLKIKEGLAEAIDAYNRNTYGPKILEFDYLNTSSNFKTKSLEDYANYPLIINSLNFKNFMFTLLLNEHKEQINNAASIIKLINSELKSD
jgi:Family of unknown function (DUF6090)